MKEWLREKEGCFCGLGLGGGRREQLHVILFVILWNSVVMECQIRGNRRFI